MVEMVLCDSQTPASQMLSSWRRCAPVFGLVCLSVAGLWATTTAAASETGVGDGWVEASSPHFTVVSNAGRRKTERVTGELEELRAALARLSTVEPVEGIPTVVFLFENDDDFGPYKYLEGGKPSAVSGFFRATPKANFIALDSGAGYDSGVVFHEYVHCWMSKTHGRLPLWVEEGLAELYQTFSVSGDTVQFGKPIERHLAWFRSHAPIPLEVLLAVDHNDPLYTREAQKSGFYAQSWALVHLLVLGDPARAPQLQHYLSLLAQGAEHQIAFVRAFGAEPKNLQDELDRYVRRKIFKIFSFDLELGPKPEIVVRTLAEAEVLTRLGELLLSEYPSRPEAREHFEQALTVDEGCGAALAGLARIAELERNWREADALHARALAVAPDDPMVLYHYGDSLIAGRGDSEVAVRVLKKSVALAPGYGPAWSTLAGALLEAGEPMEAVLAAARTAHRLLPHDRDATWDLLTALLGAGLWDEARAFVDSTFLEHAVDRGRALRLLVRRGLQNAHELIASEDCGRAAKRVDWAGAQMVGADDGRLLEAQLAEARAAVVQCHLVERFKAAEALLEDGQSEAAKAQLLTIAEQAPESGLGRRALRLVDRIDNPGREPRTGSVLAISAISENELEQLNARLAAGDLERAMEILLGLRARSGPSESVWIDNKIIEVQGALDHNRYVEGFNRGVDLFNARDFTDAIQVLEALLQDMPPGFDSSSARSLLARARAAQGR